MVDGGTFVMTGGSINRNSTYAMNGGTIVVRSGSFMMSGGSIWGNLNKINTSAVLIESGLFVMSGGVIYGNSASGAPAGLANESNLVRGAALVVSSFATAVYGNGTNILPHIDGSENGTDHTVSGKH